jgi:CRISPR-associated exonuclease Cas4
VIAVYPLPQIILDDILIDVNQMASVTEPKRKDSTKNHKRIAEVISASDIERYGYCPLNWWQKHQGTEEQGIDLERGTIHHEKIARDIENITERESIATRSQLGIMWFAIIALMLGVNGAVIIYFKYATGIHEETISTVLMVISVIWIALAVILFIYTFFRDLQAKKGQEEEPEPEEVPSPYTGASVEVESEIKPDPASSLEVKEGVRLTIKNVTQWFVMVAVALAVFGYMLEYPFAPSEVLSRILLAAALVWLMGTTVALFFVMRAEERIKLLDKGSAEVQYTKYMKRRSRYELLVVLFASGAAILGIAGFFVQYQNEFQPLDLFGRIFIILSFLWMSAGFLFFYRFFWGGVETRSAMRDIKAALALESKQPLNLKKHLDAIEKGKILSEEYSVLSMAVLAIILGINSILLRADPVSSAVFGGVLEIIALIWLVGASVFLYDVLKHLQIASSMRKHYSLSDASIEYTDTMDEQSSLLESSEHKIRGRPDYIIKRDSEIIPVEVKTGRVPRGPHFSHILQLAAYCVLVEENYNQRPPYGLIRYGKEKEFKIDYDDRLKNLVVAKISEMRKAIKNNTAHRNHNRKNKCKYCSRREGCPERLI